MTKEQSIDLAARVKGLFTRMTDPQGKLLIAEFQQFDTESVGKAIATHAARHSELDIPTLLRACDTRKPATGFSLAKERTAAEADRMRVAAKLQTVGDEELAAIKQRIVERSSDVAKRTLAKADPRQSPLLSSLIFSELKGAAR